MENFWKNLKVLLERNVISLLYGVVSVVGKIIDYLQCRRKDKAKQQAERDMQKAEKKVDDACDKGGIDDLFDAAEALKRAKQKEKDAKK